MSAITVLAFWAAARRGRDAMARHHYNLFDIMAESDKTKVLDWQQTPSDNPPENAESVSESRPTLEQARRFLDDDAVRTSSLEKKAEFLKSKGFGDEEIQKLLGGEAEPQQAKTEVETKSEPPETSKDVTQPRPSTVSSQALSTTPSSTPPIITYPEFLTHSPRPPPLITPTRLLNIFTVSGTAWTFLYGAARFIVEPMVETLNESRTDYYSHVNSKLSELVEKLEGAASEVPYKNGKLLKSDENVDVDDNSSYDDPTELFHRDIGTQTSPPPLAFPRGTAAGSTEAPIDVQARRLAQLTSSLQDLTDMYTKKAENSTDLHNTVREIRDDVDKLAYPPMPEYTSLYGGPGFGTGRSSEPNDEYQKTKDAIRSVKGLFLSARNFPAAAAVRQDSVASAR
ncbi:peroxisomal membrane anchor protein conserved region-domain-containing protein [Pseudomassariella vexata]|uniref:Peroxisomal membrane protein PEX14 n=1 Tax=Pseudomassariella vexata TaxID=1141098 RepID=A0A1Y2DYA9_9PEZI|nr:peroxisomal membrane anchor protein conserved region-domain-containing protein [Pseudomassariella vexata]ORY64227.1 peroxisomal membrane anchor protein conserved region-domain-containing protein [Pseudomassariella vexata]